ncbi:MAG: cytochrome c-type biogenesis protein CcmH [Paracoccaceae bacterium]
MKRRAFVLALLASPAVALDPSEMLQDSDLEARARALDHGIRCVKCQSESVASSNATWAEDARRQIRELISEGQSDQDVKDWFVTRYGEFVLMDPPKTGSSLALWLAGPAMLAVGALGALSYLRGRSKPEAVAALSPTEQARLDEILKK